eukprot:1150381-Pelagomonas_calceolata.AAC.2
MAHTLETLDSWAMLIAKKLDLGRCMHGCWTDAINWRGTAGFLLLGPGELTPTWPSLLADWTEFTQREEQDGVTTCPKCIVLSTQPQVRCHKDTRHCPTNSTSLQHVLITAGSYHDITAGSGAPLVGSVAGLHVLRRLC